MIAIDMRSHAKSCTLVIRFPREDSDFHALAFLPRYANCHGDKRQRRFNEITCAHLTQREDKERLSFTIS